MDRPLTVRVDLDAGPEPDAPGDAAGGAAGPGPEGFSGSAEMDIPGPLRETSILLEGQTLPVLVFDGITHVIAPGMVPKRDRFDAIKKALETAWGPAAGSPAGLSALGVMFWDSRERFMTPAVYVYRSGTLVFESSCGSGSAAMAVWLDEEAASPGTTAAPGDCGEGRYSIRQPGGIIETRVVRRDGGLSVSIGGRVTLSGKRILPL